MKLRDWAKKNDLGYKRAWDLFKMGKIPNSRKLPSGSIVVADDIPFVEEKIVVYARVSSSENKDNLEKQSERLTLYCGLSKKSGAD